MGREVDFIVFKAQFNEAIHKKLREYSLEEPKTEHDTNYKFLPLYISPIMKNAEVGNCSSLFL